jgi:hypothetical protein
MSPEKHHFKRVLPQTSKHFLTVIREHFHGQLTYASGSWENVDWKVFDFVGIDYYRDGHNKKNYREKLRTYFKYEKPVIILEFGCCTYQGAEDKGGHGWAIVARSQTPHQLKGKFIRDENVQVEYLKELLNIFKEEKVNGAFLLTFVMPIYPFNEDPRYDLDMASYSVVKVLAIKIIMTCHGNPRNLSLP